MEKVEAKLQAALERNGYTDGRSLLVVAVSGGPDSVALLHALLKFREKGYLQLHVAHLDHDFRGEVAVEDARFVAELANNLGLPSTVEKIDPMGYKRKMKIASFEELARELRYNFLARVARDTGGTAVALGHTADDLAETVMMRIMRGSGIRGLRGMSEFSTWVSRDGSESVALFRPMLEVTKEDMVAYCRSHGIAFRDDPGNVLNRFTRNRIRHKLLPELRRYNPKIREALTRLSRSAELGTDYLEKAVSEVWPSVAKRSGYSITLGKSALASMHPFLRRSMFMRAYQELAGDARRLETVHIDAMENLVNGGSGKALDLPRGLQLVSGYDELILAGKDVDICPFPRLKGEYALEPPQSLEEKTTQIPGWHITARLSSDLPRESEDPFLALLDPEAMGIRSLIRVRQPGDRFQPLGMQVEKKLQDFFVDDKVPRNWRDRIPLVVAEKGIAWVVGYRVAEWAKARPESQRILNIRFSTSRDS